MTKLDLNNLSYPVSLYRSFFTTASQQCHNNSVTTTVSQQQRHNNSATTTVSQQQRHNNTVTTTLSQLKICDFSGETFKGFEVL